MSSSFIRSSDSGNKKIKNTNATIIDNDNDSSSINNTNTNDNNNNTTSIPSPSSSPSIPPSRLLPGTKPWTGGITLTSTGQREWDNIMGGGQALGSALLIEEDRWHYDLGMTLARYWAAEAICQNQTLLLCATASPSERGGTLPQSTLSLSTADDEGMTGLHGMSMNDLKTFIHSLPRERRRQQGRKTDQTTSSSNESATAAAQSSITTINEDSDDDDENDKIAAEDNLTIAWQYRTSVQKQRLGHQRHNKDTATSTTNRQHHNPYCHSYDLSQSMIDDNDEEQQPSPHSSLLTSLPIHDLSYPHQHHPSSSRHYPLSFLKRLLTLLTNCPRHTVTRLFLPRLAPQLHSTIPILLSFIKNESLPILILLTTSHPAPALRRGADTVLTIQSFITRRYHPPGEFASFVGLIDVTKMSHDRRYALPAVRYGIKRNERRLGLEMLHLPPEEFSKGGGGSVSGGGGRGRGGGCGTGSVDF